MQQPTNELSQAHNKLVNSQSKSFEIISQLITERDESKNIVSQYAQIMLQLANVININDTSPVAIITEVGKLYDNNATLLKQYNELKQTKNKKGKK